MRDVMGGTLGLMADNFGTILVPGVSVWGHFWVPEDAQAAPGTPSGTKGRKSTKNMRNMRPQRAHFESLVLLLGTFWATCGLIGGPGEEKETPERLRGRC